MTHQCLLFFKLIVALIRSHSHAVAQFLFSFFSSRYLIRLHMCVCVCVVKHIEVRNYSNKRMKNRMFRLKSILTICKFVAVRRVAIRDQSVFRFVASGRNNFCQKNKLFSLCEFFMRKLLVNFCTRQAKINKIIGLKQSCLICYWKFAVAFTLLIESIFVYCFSSENKSEEFVFVSSHTRSQIHPIHSNM